ncbi:MAG: hypothetical protein ACKVS5_01460 [Parvularculaceae bacterium]
MLRILLIILVALAVIIGLMRLTGRSGGETPAATVGADEGTGAVSGADGSASVDDAIGALDERATVDAEAGTDVLDPSLDPSLDPALTPSVDPALDVIDEAPAVAEETIETVIDNPAPPAGENAVAEPAPDSILNAPITEAPTAEPEATTPPGR